MLLLDRPTFHDGASDNGVASSVSRIVSVPVIVYCRTTEFVSSYRCPLGGICHPSEAKTTAGIVAAHMPRVCVTER